MAFKTKIEEIEKELDNLAEIVLNQTLSPVLGGDKVDQGQSGDPEVRQGGDPPLSPVQEAR